MDQLEKVDQSLREPPVPRIPQPGHRGGSTANPKLQQLRSLVEFRRASASDRALPPMQSFELQQRARSQYGAVGLVSVSWDHTNQCAGLAGSQLGAR